MSDLKFHWYSKFRIKLFQPKRYPLVSLRGYLFLPIHINKNAGTSLLKAFGKDKFHLTVEELQQFLGTQVFEQAIKIAVIRNPYDRVVSQYYHRVKTNQNNLYKNPIGLNKWVEKVYQPPYDDNYRTSQQKMFIPQYNWLIDKQNNFLVDHLFRFEQLEDDFSSFCKKYDLTLNLMWENKTKVKDEELNLDSVRIINEYFEDDFRIFKYSMKTIK